MDNIPQRCYNEAMEERLMKQEGFKGERMFVLPAEVLREYLGHPLAGRLYLTDVGFFPHAKNHARVRKTGVEEYILLYCVEGRGSVEVEGREYRLEENQAFCIPAGRPHRYQADEQDPWSLLWVHFKGEDAALYPLEECRVVNALPAEENRLAFLFQLLFDALEDDYSLGNFIYMAQVLSLILAQLYCRSYTDKGAQNRYLTQAIRCMYRNLGRAMTLDELAEEVGLSKSYLHQIFVAHTGRAPLEFFSRLKVEEACKLLKATDHSIGEIAQRVGFGDPYYFSRLFKKAVGVSPKKYRDQPLCYSERAERLLHPAAQEPKRT